jgi:hypothetical protein
MDVDARIQLFDLKKKYQFITTPGVDQYNMPLYDLQIEGTTNPQSISFYPVYQGFLGPVYVDGVEISFQTEQRYFLGNFPTITPYAQVLTQGNGTSGPYTLRIPAGLERHHPSNPPFNPPFSCILRGHVDISGIIATGVNQDPPLVSDAEILANAPFIQTIPTTSVFPAVYFTSIGADGANIVISDSGQFLQDNQNRGLLMQPGKAPLGNLPLPNGYSASFVITAATNANPAVLTSTTNFQAGQTVEIDGVNGMTELNGNTYTVVSVTPTTVTINVDSTGFGVYTSGGMISSEMNTINYFTGCAENVYFPEAIPAGVNIYATYSAYQTGLPRMVLYYNNTLTFRVPPAQQYLVEIDGYLSPAAFLNGSEALQFGYMAEYIARGAARKILSDTGDIEQFQFYEPLFSEQEQLVWKRSQRQWTATRTHTLYSQGSNQWGMGNGGANGGNSI